ncbi:MurR/RpiR family transcriptional regulator [Coprobacillus sp. AF34-1BH]|nr:phosphosugar-binding transcriptional regulator, RpiR family [Coprobacillus sp. 8_1_38FAA]RGT61553.1 MurR/RpiR family transcriptional regulator [Coprobacillus sp. AF18-40]RGT87526.1 MurR/RpiR family transcriptional regulator [Coprobacillus sp. AF18-15LB]RHH09939.1 MurR/RpiR family transcriptional regulator [Coprobacillus sp. AM18-4LB-d2]RHP25370.1 MurR/RpiR family transcriptional regulator [Coprobacillus sp. AF34-1BH]
MNLFINLKENKDLSKNERVLADYILKHPEDVLKMSSKYLGKVCFVSTATVYRLCDKLGLSGFSDLKIKITSSLDDYRKSNEDFNFDFPVNQFQTHYEIIQKIKEDYEQTLNLTANLFSLDQLRLIASAMEKSQIIDVYTSAGNINFALNFQFQMQEIGIQVNVPIDEYQQRLTAASSNENHLAIIITFGGRGILSDILPRILHKVKTPIVLISSYDYTFEDLDPDYQLYISPYENHYKKISSFSTRLSILYILDVLYTCYFKLDYQENIKKKLAYYNNIVEGTIK